MTDKPFQLTPADQGFFRGLVTAMAIVLVSGFVVQLAAGRSSFNAPLIVHLHAVTFMGWAAIIVTQSWLQVGNVALHRTLGRIAVVWALGVLILGPLVTLNAARAGRVPFFFQPQHFLIADPASILAGLAFFGAGIAMRRRPDWHARLQIASFLMILGPGPGRLLPMPLLAPWAFETAGLVCLIFPAIGMVRDLRVHRRIHPAWWWAVGGLIGVLVLARVLAFSPIGDAIWQAATAGTPAAGIDGRAFPPPPGPPPGPAPSIAP